jgi:hypothetical protein
MTRGNTFFFILLIIWTVIGSGISTYFALSRNIRAKKKLYPALMAVFGICALWFCWYIGAPPALVVLAIAPFIAATTAYQIWRVRFCGKCGSTVYNQMVFSRPEFCMKCGCDLNEG